MICKPVLAVRDFSHKTGKVIDLRRGFFQVRTIIQFEALLLGCRNPLLEKFIDRPATFGKEILPLYYIRLDAWLIFGFQVRCQRVE